MGKYVVCIDAKVQIQAIVLDVDSAEDAEDQAMYQFENKKIKDFQSLETHVEIIPLDDTVSEGG